MTENLTKEELYNVYSENIRYADLQLEILRKNAREIAAEYYWYKEKKQKKCHKELKAITNLYAYILGNKFELQLMKIIHENSAAAFSYAELEDIKSQKTMYDKWKRCLDICFSKNNDNIRGLEKKLEDLFSEQENYMKVIQEIITMRNKLAHGQWSIQLNSTNARTVNLEILNNYPDISKLIWLKKKLEVLVEIVETIVVYKDKSTDKYKDKIKKLIEENNSYDIRIRNAELRKYIDLEYKKIKNREDEKRKRYSKT